MNATTTPAEAPALRPLDEIAASIVETREVLHKRGPFGLSQRAHQIGEDFAGLLGHVAALGERVRILEAEVFDMPDGHA